MADILYLCRDVTRGNSNDLNDGQWSALPRDFKQGEYLFRFRGHTYGLDRDDMVYGGFETIPMCTQPDSQSFFTVPVAFLVDRQGYEPSGDYVSMEKIQKALKEGNAPRQVKWVPTTAEVQRA